VERAMGSAFAGLSTALSLGVKVVLADGRASVMSVHAIAARSAPTDA
jgi:hypothetical protein